MSPLVSPVDSIPGKKLKAEVIIADVSKDSPAAAADLKPGDIAIKGVYDNDVRIFSTPQDLISFTSDHKNQAVELTIKRDDNETSKEVYLSGNDTPLGVSIVEKAIVKVPWYKAPVVALRETYGVTKLTGEFLGGMFKKLFLKGQVSEEVGGPVAIYVYTGMAVKAGFMVMLQFIAMLSINLALINILPFPALDGGRILFIILEKVFGKKVVKEKIENIIHTVGFGLLILLIVALTYKDVLRYIIK
jgi:regulator of sigma E protease